MISKPSSSFEEVISFERNSQNAAGQLQTGHSLGKIFVVCGFSTIFQTREVIFLKNAFGSGGESEGPPCDACHSAKTFSRFWVDLTYLSCFKSPSKLVRQDVLGLL